MKSNKDKQKLLDELAKTPIVELACKKVGIGRTTYYRWLKGSASFRSKVEELMVISRGSVNDLAESKLIKGIQNDDYKSIRFWLVNNHPRYTSDTAKMNKQSLEIDSTKKLKGFKVIVHHAKPRETEEIIKKRSERTNYIEDS